MLRGSMSAIRNTLRRRLALTDSRRSLRLLIALLSTILAPYNSLGFSDVTSVSISQLASGSGYWFISSLTRDTVSAPEGGASLLYLLLAAGACFGAIFFRSRNRFASRAQA